MTVEGFLKNYRPEVATAVETLLYCAVEALQEIRGRLMMAVEATESEVLTVRRRCWDRKDIADLCFNTAGEVQSVTNLNMTVAEFMTQREVVHGLMKAYEKERDGKREWWKEWVA